MKIETQEQARVAIGAVCEWLRLQAAGENQAGEIWQQRGEPEIAETARDFCEELLDAAKADGNGGCRYCGQ